jgi:hypothetical protein
MAQGVGPEFKLQYLPPPQKKKTHCMRAGGVAQVVEHLCSKH